MISNQQKDPTTSTNSLKLIGSCKNIHFDNNFMENMDATKTKGMGLPIHIHTIQDNVNAIVKTHFQNKSVIA